MNTKLNFFKSAIACVEDKPDFMANTLKKYRELEKISESELINILQCSVNDYYKLALCTKPDFAESDFKSRLSVISEYAGIDTNILTKIIKHVYTVSRFTVDTGAILMAARDKEKKKKDEK